MSDQDDKTVPTAPDEANAAETPAPRDAEASPEGRPSALADALGEDPDASVSDVTETPQAAAPIGDEPVAEPAADARAAESETQAADPAAVPAAPAASEPASAAAEPAPAPAETPADAPAAKPEPDYAALAAELDELEARHGAVGGAEPAAPAEPSGAATGTAAAAAAGAGSSPWFERADETQTFRATEPEAAPAVTASEPVVAPAAAPAPAPQPVFVEAPEPPTKRGNRGAVGLIGLVAAIVFALLTFAVRIGFGALEGDVSFDNIADASVAIATSWTFWIPVVAFFLAFWLIGALINNGRWVAWVLLGFFVGLVAYAGHVFAPVLAGPFWWLTQSEGIALIEENLLTPFSIAAFIIGREVTIWFGGWAAKRGARMNALNAEAQAEYDKTLEAGPAA